MFGKKYLTSHNQGHAIINASINKVNLGDWMFTLTSDEYKACASGHQSAAQGRTLDGKRLSINIETIGEALFVQHYIEEFASRERVLGISPNSSMWARGRLLSVEVHWELSVEKIDENSCRLTCDVKSYTGSLLFALIAKAMIRKMPKDKRPVYLHVKEESPLFAKDIERKANSGVWS